VSRGKGAGEGSGAVRGGPGRPDTGPDGLTISQAQAAVDAWISRFEEGYWPPLANLARLVEEVGELARELTHRHGPKPKKPGEPEADLGLELADILFVLIALANEQGIDLEAAFRRVLEKYRVRDADRWTPKGEPS
jgi:NTP pyrophosphatase (non-canonical NTP hydrolase)